MVERMVSSLDRSKPMTIAKIQIWLTYWNNAGMVALDEIRSIEDVVQARRFCACMRVGVFTLNQVSDLQIWRALCARRSLAA
jgi:hypothetical protein